MCTIKVKIPNLKYNWGWRQPSNAISKLLLPTNSEFTIMYFGDLKYKMSVMKEHFNSERSTSQRKNFDGLVMGLS